MQIFVKYLTGKSIAMDVDLATQTVDDVKMHVQKVEGITPGMQRLIYCGKQLQDGVRLADYNVPNNGTLHLVVRLLGGH